MTTGSASSKSRQTVPKPKRKPPPGKIIVLPPEHFESLPVAEREWSVGPEKKQARMRNIFAR